VVLGTAGALLLAAGGGCGGTSKPTPQPHSAKATRHYAFETNADQRRALSLGFDVLDVTGSGSDPSRTKAIVDALPRGVQGLIWVGNLDNTSCTTPGYTTAQFRALVGALASDRKVYGYYLADEPHPETCPQAAADIRARADFLHAHSRFQKAFIVVLDGSGPCGSDLGCEFEALQPRKTHVDLVGVDPYPCHYESGGRAAVPCDFGLIRERVAAATSHGIPQSAIVPLFQEFGQQGRVGGAVYYRMPGPNELRTILATWHELIPSPALDAAYTFGTQCSTTCPAPQALQNHPEAQSVVRAYNR
jgi:hypothetical protein